MPETPIQRLWLFVAVEASMSIVIFLVSLWWGTAYWNRSLALGRAPMFYQEYFEPAVMVACHRGFVVSHPAPAALVDFLQRRTDHFDCGAIPSSATLNTQGLYQGAWRYMMVTVGLAWRWLGISWRRLGPLFGLLFGATIACAYGIFRLGMGPLLSIAGALMLSVSTLHLTNLPHLRDYSKAPFTLALVLLLGLLVRVRPRRAIVVSLSAAYGVVLAVGYGFRTDLLVAIPPLFVVLFLFLDGGVRGNLATKTLGAATFLMAFLISAQPIYSFVYEKGGGQWHVALLGLGTDFDGGLGIVRAPYDWGRVYEDEYIIQTVDSYVRRVHPDWRVEHLGTRDYDVNSGAYFRELMVRFPADIVTRAYASTFQIIEMPFKWIGPPISDRWQPLYKWRASLLSALSGRGTLVVTLALVAAAAADLRLGLFLLFIVLYFGGYPAIQFSNRHYFHLEFLTWWAIGFLLHHAGARAVRSYEAWRRGSAAIPWTPLSLRRAGAFVAGTLLLLMVPLAVLRAYQGLRARQLFRSYIAAGKEPIPISPDPDGFAAVSWPGGMDVRLMEVDLALEKCERRTAVTFRYDSAQPVFNYTGSFSIPPKTSSGLTRMFVPLYPHAFQGLVLDGIGHGCVTSASWVDTGTMPVLLDVTLAPDWDQSALYQRLPIELSIF